MKLYSEFLFFLLYNKNNILNYRIHLMCEI